MCFVSLELSGSQFLDELAFELEPGLPDGVDDPIEPINPIQILLNFEQLAANSAEQTTDTLAFDAFAFSVQQPDPQDPDAPTGYDNAVYYINIAGVLREAQFFYNDGV